MSQKTNADMSNSSPRDAVPLSINKLQSYLIDFGMSINWADAYGSHEPAKGNTAQVLDSTRLKYENISDFSFFVQEGCFNGTMQFASLNVMRGLRPSRRDDIVSLVRQLQYMNVFILHTSCIGGSEMLFAHGPTGSCTVWSTLSKRNFRGLTVVHHKSQD